MLRAHNLAVIATLLAAMAGQSLLAVRTAAAVEPVTAVDTKAYETAVQRAIEFLRTAAANDHTAPRSARA